VPPKEGKRAVKARTGDHLHSRPNQRGIGKLSAATGREESAVTEVHADFDINDVKNVLIRLTANALRARPIEVDQILVVRTRVHEDDHHLIVPGAEIHDLRETAVAFVVTEIPLQPYRARRVEKAREKGRKAKTSLRNVIAENGYTKVNAVTGTTVTFFTPKPRKTRRTLPPNLVRQR
jgi:hypothetical protein